MHLLLLFRGPDGGVPPPDVVGSGANGGAGSGQNYASNPKFSHVDQQNSIAVARVIAFVTAGSMQ